MKIDLTPCYILHHRNFSESSLILDVFSRNYGRINLIVKGAKRNKKYYGINFDLYQKYNISWVSKSELGTLIEIEIAVSKTSFNPKKAIIGFYINEIILKLLHKHEPHPELFDIYELTLNKLFANENEKILLRYFEKQLLQSLGYGISLDYDTKTGSLIDPSIDYYYKIESGPSLDFITPNEGMKISGKTLFELNNETLSDNKNINEAKDLLGMILRKYINQPLESKKLYMSYTQIKNNLTN